METLEAINKRFSARSFTDKQVSWASLEKILRAAIRAPNAGNVQSFKFIIITNEIKKEKLAKASFNQSWLAQAPVIIVICSSGSDLEKLYHEQAKTYSIQDCSAAAENILLSAAGLGINSCWVGAFDHEEVSTILGIPPGVTPHIIIPLGYSKEEQSSTRHHIEFLVHYNEFGTRERSPGQISNSPGLFPTFKAQEKLEKKSKNLSVKIKEKFKRKK